MHSLNIITFLLLLTSFAFKKKHILTVLLSLELLSIMIIMMTLLIGLELFIGLIMLCIGACEGAVGLSAMIRATRCKRRHRLWIG